MKDIFDRIGVYDFFGICGAGTIFIIYSFCTELYINQKNMYEAIEKISSVNSIFMIIVFLILSYFIGTIFHEIGKLIVERIKDFRVPSIGITLETNKFKRPYKGIYKLNPLNKIRKDFKSHVEKVDPTIKFHYALSYFKNKGCSTLLDKYHSLYGLSRGIFVGCLVHILLICLFHFNVLNMRIFRIIILDLLLSGIFFCRSYRFYLVWVQNVFIQHNLCTTTEEKRRIDRCTI